MGDVVYVRNSIVRENFWKKENFFETKKDGFVAASQEYDTPSGSILVVFKDRQAGLLIDSDTGLTVSNEDLTSELAGMVKDGIINDSFEDIYPDNYVQVGVKGVLVDESMLDEFGFTAEQKKDIEDRMSDLENYWDDVVEDM